MCPESVRLAYNIASRNNKVTAQVIVANEFPMLKRDYGVMIVPKIWVNDRVYTDGAPPERLMLMALKQALNMNIQPGKLIISR